MGWLSFLCSKPSAELVECRAERAALLTQREQAQNELTLLRGEVERLEHLAESLVGRAESAESDAARFYAELEKAIRVPDLSAVLKAYPRTLIDPWTMTPAQWKAVRPILTSDLNYYAFSEEGWLALLAPIQAEAKKAVGRAKPEVADCDNWTLTMCDLVALTFIRAGLDRQGAFLKLLSKPHSYCGFMLPDMRVRVYEPMSGEVVGWLGETGPGLYGDDTYKTEQAYFLS